MKIGVSSYSYSQYLRDGRLDLFSVIAKAAEMGFEALEFTDLPKDAADRPALARQLKAEADRIGIPLSAYCCGSMLYCEPAAQQAEVARLKGELDIAAILGVKVFRYDVLYRLPMHTAFDKVLETVAPAMRELAEYGAALGIKTSIENHGLAFQDYDRIEKTYLAVDHENFGLLLDIGNFLCADQDNVQCVSRLANLAFHVHLKDFTILDYDKEGERPAQCFRSRACNDLLGCAVGYGDARSAQCLAVLKQAGYDGYVDIEFEGPNDCITELEKGLAFFRSWN